MAMKLSELWGEMMDGPSYCDKNWKGIICSRMMSIFGNGTGGRI
jgi:hypothetical protein